jgi:hypothetical protein
MLSEHLTRPEMLLNGLYNWAEAKLPWWLHKPLITCYKCVAGQWAFWAYVSGTISVSFPAEAFIKVNSSGFNPCWLFSCACAGVAISILLHKILDHE